MNRRSFMRLISSAFVVDDGQKKKKKKIYWQDREGFFGNFTLNYSLRYSHVIFNYLRAIVGLIDKFLRPL